MIGTLTRILCGTTSLVLASTAQAQYQSGGLLQWSFDDVTVSASQGRRRSTALNQSYRYSVGGPLGTPLLGEGRASVSMMEGKSLAQSVVGTSAEQKILGYSFHGSLLPPGLRQFVTLAPSISRSKTTQVWGLPSATRDLIENARGLTAGLTLPRLPNVSVMRQHIARTDGSSPSILDQATDLGTEQVAYVSGPLRTEYRHDTTATNDRLNPNTNTRMGLTSANFEINMPERAHKAFKSVFWRESYQAQRTDFPASFTRQESYASNLYIVTRHMATRYIDSYLGYNAAHNHSLSEPKDSAQNALTLFSTGFLRRGRVDNQFSYRRSDGRNRQDDVQESAITEWGTTSGRYEFHAETGGGWARSPQGGSSISDALRQRVTWTPRHDFSGYAEAGTNGSTPLGDAAGGSRQNLGGAGAGLRLPYTDLSSNYSLSRSRNLALGMVTMNQGLTATAQTSPIDGMRANFTYAFNWSRSTNGVASRNDTLGLTLGYKLDRLECSGELISTGHALNAALESGYTLGRMRVSVRLERVELYTVNSYSRVNMTLARYL